MAYRNRANIKKLTTSSDSTRKREETTIELRRNKREESNAKRRQDTLVVSRSEKENTVQNSQTSTVRSRLKDLPLLVQGINSNNGAKVLESVKVFRQLLSIEKSPPIQEVIDSGVCPKLVSLLTCNHTDIQFEAAWALTNIASGTSKHTRCVVDLQGIPPFVFLLKSPNVELKEQAVWALGNIAGDSALFRDQVLKHGGLAGMASIIQQTDARLSLLRNTAWAISNLCRGKPQPPAEAVLPILPTLCKLLSHDDEEVLADTLWAFSYLSDDHDGNKKISAVVKSGCLPRVVQLLMHKNVAVKTPALRVAGNVVSGDDTQTQAALDCSLLPALVALLTHAKKSIRKEAAWTISNITAGTADQIEAVLRTAGPGNPGIVRELVNLLRTAEFDIQKEAAWAISNATSGGKDIHIIYLMEQGVLSPLCELFTVQDVKIVMVALEAVENILKVGKAYAPHHWGGQNKFVEALEECGGLDKLEGLQTHDNEDVYKKALKMLQTYFDQDEEEESLAPAQTQNAFAFGLQAQQQPTQKPFSF